MRKIAELAERAITEGVFPGCVIGIMHGPERWTGAFGHFTYEANTQVHDDTVYDVASLTKSVIVATLTHQLINEKKITLDTRLIEYLPDFHGGYRDDITVRHLLTYTLGGIRMSEFKDESAARILDIMLHFTASHPPGEKFEYSNVPAFLLGLFLENILGPLEKAATEQIFKPFDMDASTFFPHGAAPTEIDFRGVVQDVVHDESAYVFRKAGRTVGHAGLFSTVPDLMRFLDQFHIGRMSAVPAETNQLARLGAFAGLGWELNQGHFMGTRRQPCTFGKTGFTGCSMVCDAKHRISIVILSNRTFPHRSADASAINAFRNAVCDIVFP